MSDDPTAPVVVKLQLADCGSTSLITNNRSPAFTAPEILRMQSFNKKADVYSFGIVLWTIISQKLPYQQHSLDVTSHVTSGRREIIPRDCPGDIASLIKQCWTQNPEERPDISTVIQELTNISSLI